MFCVWTLALSGLFLIFLEFFLPGSVMAIGGALLLLSSLFFFHMGHPSFVSFALYFSSLIVAIYLVVRVALWVTKWQISKQGDKER